MAIIPIAAIFCAQSQKYNFSSKIWLYFKDARATNPKTKTNCTLPSALTNEVLLMEIAKFIKTEEPPPKILLRTKTKAVEMFLLFFFLAPLKELIIFFLKTGINSKLNAPTKSPNLVHINPFRNPSIPYTYSNTRYASAKKIPLAIELENPRKILSDLIGKSKEIKKPPATNKPIPTKVKVENIWPNNNPTNKVATGVIDPIKGATLEISFSFTAW